MISALSNPTVVDFLDLKVVEEVDRLLSSSYSPTKGLSSSFCKMPSSRDMLHNTHTQVKSDFTCIHYFEPNFHEFCGDVINSHSFNYYFFYSQFISTHTWVLVE